MKLRESIADAPMAVIVAALIAAGLLLVGLYAAFAADLRAQLQAEILSDIVATKAANRVLPAVTALTVLDGQSAGKTGLLYLMIDPETRETIAGNLPSWPTMSPGADGCGSVKGLAGRAMIACTTLLDGHFPLLIARSTAGIGSSRSWMLLGYGYGALVIVTTIAGAAAGWFRLSRLRRRLAGIQGALDTFAGGDLAARPPPGGGDLVGQLSSGVSKTLDDLNHAITGQHVIAERIAHDLKRPVAIALATLDLDRPSAESLASCRERLADLNRIVDGVLRISEVAMRDDPLGPVALDEAVESVAELYGEAAASREIRIVTKLDPITVMGRQELVDRLLANLMDNAVKYTAHDTEVTISVRTDGPNALISVADHGPGTAGLPAQHGTYFARGPAANGIEGSGLGLAAVRRIVELSKGNLRLTDRPDGPGLVVEVRLPTGKTPTP